MSMFQESSFVFDAPGFTIVQAPVTPVQSVPKEKGAPCIKQSRIMATNAAVMAAFENNASAAGIGAFDTAPLVPTRLFTY